MLFAKQGFPQESMVKKPPANIEDTSSILGFGRSLGGESGNLLPAFWPEKFHGQRSLVGDSPWGCKESDMTEHLSIHTRICKA